MGNRRILVLTKSKKVCQTFEWNLRMFFEDHIHIYTAHEDLELNEQILQECDLVLVSSKSILEGFQEIIAEIPVIMARRTVHLPKLEPLMNLTAGTRCLFVSNSLDTIEESTELLVRLGIDHLQFVPFVPDSKGNVEPVDIDIAITHGLEELIPSTINRVIDLGTRPIDLTTIFDIAQHFDLPMEKAHFYTAEFFHDFVSLGKNLAHSVKNEKRLNQQLESVLNAVHEGIIGIDETGRVSVFNKEAENILKQSAGECVGKSYMDVIPEFKLHGIFQTLSEEQNQLLKVRNLILLVTKVPMVLDGHLLGVVVTFQDVTKVQQVEQEIRKKSTELGLTTKYTFQNIIGISEPIIASKEVAMKLAGSDFTVLITGENGTGKEVFAQAIHQHSSRRDGPFVPVNFAGLSESLAESELFGYEEGSFTGAKKGGKMGLFELAHNGTIFLDEIGDAPLSIQAALLRVLQEKQVMRVGGNRVIPINVRVVAATNRNLMDMIAKGTFREDLYYRLNVLPLHIPNLRERREDLFILIDHFLQGKSKKLTLDPDVKQVILNYNWPGNIRELENFIHYLMVIVAGERVKLEHIPEWIRNASAPSSTANTKKVDEVDEIIHMFVRQGSRDEYEDILHTLWKCSKWQGRVGRNVLSSMLTLPMSESQIRNKLTVLNRCGCIAVGVKKQGTSITPFGIEVLARMRDEEIIPIHPFL